MEHRLARLKTLSTLYRMKRLGLVYHEPVKPAALVEPMPEDPARFEAMVRNCHLCELSKRRKHALSGVGTGESGVMVVIDAPSAAEDASGRWYEGRSGELLGKMIEGGLGLPLASVYLTAALKCHPAGRAPQGAMAQCRSYLAAELERVTPKVVLALGQGAFEALTEAAQPVSAARGRSWPIPIATTRAVAVASFSPAYLLLNPSSKKEALEDLRLALKIAGR
ncbi:MAG: uracil-DNA glycosylase [Campylobacterales bacterium]